MVGVWFVFKVISYDSIRNGNQSGKYSFYLTKANVNADQLHGQIKAYQGDDRIMPIVDTTFASTMAVTSNQGKINTNCTSRL